MFLIVFPVAGVVLFRPQRARRVKYAESQSENVVRQHITELAVIHPEIVKWQRIDRHPYFIAPHIGVFGYACCLFLGATVTSNVAEMSVVTRYTMGVCFIIGSTLVLTASTLGVQVGRWTIAPRVRHHATAPLLGDDISLPYRLACAGLFAVCVSMAIYSWNSFQSTTGSLGGWLTGLLAIFAVVTAPMLFRRIREFERNEAMLLAEVRTRIERDR